MRRLIEGVDGAVDQAGAVVYRHQLHPGWQALAQLLQLLLDGGDGLEGIAARPHQDDATDDLTLAVQIGDAFAHARAQAYLGDVAETEDGARDLLGLVNLGAHAGAHASGSLVLGRDREIAQVLEPAQVAGDADHVARLRHFQGPGAGLAGGALDGLHEVDEGQLVAPQHVGIDDHLILLDHAANRGDLGDSGHGLELVFEEPILEAAQLGQVMLSRAIHQGILIDPTDGGGVRPQLGAGRDGEARRHLAQQFQYPGTGPVGVGAIPEDDINIGIAVHGIAAHGHGPSDGPQGGGDGVGHLVFHHLGGLTGVTGLDDNLDVRQVGNGVERDISQGIDAPHHDKRGGEEDHEAVVNRPGDDARYHGLAPAGAASVWGRALDRRLSPAWRLASESSRN